MRAATRDCSFCGQPCTEPLDRVCRACAFPCPDCDGTGTIETVHWTPGNPPERDMVRCDRCSS